MHLRDLAIVLLRLLAVCLACSALLAATGGFYILAEMVFGGSVSLGGTGMGARYALIQLIVPSLHLVIAGLLFVYAPPLADRICRGLAEGADARPVLAVGPGDLYHLTCFLTGLWLLARAVRPGVRALVELVAQGGLPLLPATTVAELAEAGVLAVFAAALIFGSRGLSRLLASLGHDPESVPAQQFSLRLLLGIVIGVALLLIVLRALLH